MTIGRESVRAILIDNDSRMLLVKRTKPGEPPYWTTPGGGIEESDSSAETALHRELAEELGATATVLPRVFLHSATSQSGTDVQHFYLARLIKLDSQERHGPEFDDPRRGGYDLERIDLGNLDTIDLKPSALKEFIQANRDILLAEAAVAGPYGPRARGRTATWRSGGGQSDNAQRAP